MMTVIYCELKKIMIVLLLFVCYIAEAQVGIGTTNPNPNALLDVDASDIKGGVLMPRIALTSTISPYPLVNHVAGMTLYNTASTTGANNVSPGYYFNNGIRWLRLVTEVDVDTKAWRTDGNAGTSAGTNFIGTTDNQAMVVKTNNANRFRFTETGSVHSYGNGIATSPSYAWTSSPTTGIFKPSNLSLGFSTSGIERFRIPNANQVHGVSTGTGAFPFYSWAAYPGTGIFMPTANAIGFSTSATERVRIGNGYQILAMGTGSAALPFYSWNAANNIGIFRAGTSMGFSTNGAERMRVADNGNIGINTTIPAQPLHVNGNMRFHGALMPNNNAGTTGQMLESRGPNNSPVWGPRIRKFITSTHNINSNTRTSILFSIPGLSPNDAIFATLRGNWTTNPRVSIDYIEARNNTAVLVVSNNTGGIFGGGTNYLDMDFIITIIQNL